MSIPGSAKKAKTPTKALQDEHIKHGSTIVKVVTIPVGQGDSTLIECPGPNGDMTLIDMGADEYALSKSTYVEQVLAHTGDGARLKHIFLTHPDKDHISHGLATQENDGLLNQINSNVKIYIGKKDGWENDKFPKEILDIIERKPNLKLQPKPGKLKMIYICGGANKINGVKLQFINSDLGRTKNSRSMVLKLINGKTSMLFLGDLEDSPAISDPQTAKEPVIENLIKKHKVDLKANVIMIPHHGSGNNGNGEKNLYEVVGAKSAIISSHIESTHDHPRRKTIQAFCHELTIESCDIPCGYEYKSWDSTLWGIGESYTGQTELTGAKKAKKAAFCPSNDVTAWAPFKSVNPDLSGTTNYKSRNTPYQTLTCTGKEIYQTTRFIEDKTTGVQVQAFIIGTYLDAKAGKNQVRHNPQRLEKDGKNFKPLDGTNMFDMI